jgi:3-dehydroquinate dehydratase-2
LARVVVLNGVNLGSLGERRPDVYGKGTLRDIEEMLRSEFPDVELEFRQTDHEAEFIAWVRESADSDGLVVNPGAWSHYSYALHDALEAMSVPTVEVHLSNVHARVEAWRHVSVVSPVVDAVVAGMGADGYAMAIRYLLGR